MRPIAIFLLLLIFTACSKLKDKQKAPEAFFMQSEAVAVSTTTLQGTQSHKITDLWYYVNGQYKGAYPTGNIFPVASTGPTQLTVYAGIKNNGISTTRLPYEFYEPLVIDTAIDPGKLVKRNFTFKYKSGTKFNLVEPFEGFGSVSGTSIKVSNNSDTTFQILDKTSNPSADVFEGNKCMYFAVDNVSKIAQFETTVAYNLPKSGQAVYLELNYKCSQPFDVGVFSGSSFQYAGTVNTSPEWNKIYIQLSTAVSSLPNTSCQLYIRTLFNGEASYQQFWIDNIKILSY
jgi:hypothetical protein